MEKFMGLQKESIAIDLDTVAADRQAMLEPLRRSAEAELFRWKFPCDVDLPPLPERQTSEMKFDQLFEPFKFDETEEIARGPDGSLKKLTAEQLRSIRSWGNFEIDSVRFPGQKHRWQLSCILQKGSNRDRKNLNLALAKALKFFVIYAKDRYNAKFFSLGHTYRGVRKGLLLVVDLFFGRPHNVPVNCDDKMASERLAHLLAELDVADEFSLAQIEAFAALIDWKLKFLKQRHYADSSVVYRNHDILLEQKRAAISPVYQYVSAGGKTEVDIRSRNSLLWSKLAPKITALLDRDKQTGWFHEFRHDLFVRYKAEETDNDKLVAKVQKEVDEEQISRIFKALQDEEEIKRICGGSAQFLITVAKTNLVVTRVQQRYSDMLASEQRELDETLARNYPIRSKIQRWMRRQRRYHEEQFHKSHKWLQYEMALQEAQKAGLSQFAYFLQRDFNFASDHQPNLETELQKITEPARVFTFRTRIWMPKNWVVSKWDEESGTDVVVKTVVSPTVLSRDQVRLVSGGHQPHYSLQKTTDRLVSTKWPFWRWGNYCHRVWSWTWNAVFTLCVVVPWCSPFSIRAAVSGRKFYPDYKLCSSTGQLHPDPGSETHTYVSRLRALWSHVRSSRIKFEATADRGFVSKDVIRPLNRFWNYVVKGAFGSIILTALPPFCILLSVSSFALGLLAPLFMPIVALLAQLFMLFFYDFDCPYKHRSELRRNRFLLFFEAIVYRLVFLSVIQPAAIFIFVAAICPVCATIITVGSYVRYGIRSAWDSLMFHIIIKRHGRVPSVNSWVAKRTSGPGMSSGYFYQIQSGQALTLLQLELQRKELQTFETMAFAQLSRPLENYEKWVKATLEPFGVSIAHGHNLHSRIDFTSEKIRAQLREKVQKRREFLKSPVGRDQNLHLVKQTADDLEVTMESAAELTQNFYANSPVLSLLDLAKVFTDQQLAQGDWHGCAERIFSHIFSPEFLQPLEATDARFQLKVRHVGLDNYMSQLISAKHREDLDVVDRHITTAPKLESSVRPAPLDLRLFTCDRYAQRPKLFDHPAGQIFWFEAPGYQPHAGIAMATVASRRNFHGVTTEWLKDPVNRATVVDLVKRRNSQDDEDEVVTFGQVAPDLPEDD